MSPESTPLLKVERLKQSYPEREGRQELTLFSDLNLCVQRGTTTALTGRSGSGKSSLLSILGALRRPTFGEVFLEGRSLTKMSDFELCEVHNKRIGFLYQFHHLLPEFSALENVMMPLLIAGIKRETAASRARAELLAMDLKDRESHPVQKLSGGERQRVAVARTMVSRPGLILMDEPTGNLDPQNAEILQKLILSLQKQYESTFIIVTHDLAWARSMDVLWSLEDQTIHIEPKPAQADAPSQPVEPAQEDTTDEAP